MSWAGWTWWVANREDVVALATVIGSIATLVAGLIGLWLLFVRTRAADRIARAALDQAKVAADQAKTAGERHEEQTNADRERRITESFAKAVEQLGSDKVETRLGAIYTLERISKESEREYWPIIEILTAFVRERAPWPRPTLEGEHALPVELDSETEELVARVRPNTDIQSVLTVLGRRDDKMRQQEQAAGRCVDLSCTDLRGAELPRAHLERVKLEWAHLEEANLEEAHLEGSVLFGTHLEGANLKRAYINHGEEPIDSAAFWGVHLDNSKLYQTHIEGADLSLTTGLTQAQVDVARGDESTRLPAGLMRPARWSRVTLDKPAG